MFAVNSNYFAILFFSIIVCSTTITPTTTVTTTTTATASVEQRLSEERLPGEPGPSTDGEQPWPANAITVQGRDDISRQSSPSQEQSQQDVTVADDMITVAACGSRTSERRTWRIQPPSSVLFPADVADRLRSSSSAVASGISSARPRQYGRRRSVQDAVASAVAQRQQLQQQLLHVASLTAAINESDTDRADPQEQEHAEPSRLATPLR